MFALTSNFCYYLYREPTDMRKGFNGLSALVHSRLRRYPTSGEVFIFINKRRDLIKLLRWENDGFVLYYKRLEQGTLELPGWDSASKTYTMSWSELVMMIEGISLKDVRRRKRYSRYDDYQQDRA